MRIKQISASLFTAAIVAAAATASSGYADASQHSFSSGIADTSPVQSSVPVTQRAPDAVEAVVTTSPVTAPPVTSAATVTSAKTTAETAATSSETDKTSSVTSATTPADTKPAAVTTTTVPVTTVAPATTTTAAPVEAPSATNITQAYFTDGVLSVKWKAANCDGYRVLYRVRGTSSWANAAADTELTELSYKGLNADTCYEIAVQPLRRDSAGKPVYGELCIKDVMNHTAVNYKTPKAIWIPFFTIEALMKGKSEAQFTKNFSAVCENAKELGVNTLYVHARAFSDAFYQSDIYPWSRYCTGTVGVSPGYDPLKIMTDTAHKYGLSIHAWINPYRAETPNNLKATPASSPVKKWYSDPAAYKQYVNYAETYGFCWLNPGYPAVRELIARGAEEIVSHYPVDGIHIDDYFYPTTDASFDKLAYFAYGGSNSLAKFRMSNCTETVKGLYNAVKTANPSALFGISPQGNYENNYDYMYADVDKWLSASGYCDYMAPQVYFGYENQSKPFKETAEFWLSLPRDKSVAMYIGIAPANLWLVSEFEDSTGIIGSQIADSFALGASGVALYSYESLFMPPDGQHKRTADEIAAIKAALK